MPGGLPILGEWRPQEVKASPLRGFDGRYVHEVIDQVPGEDARHFRSVTDDAYVLVGLGDVFDLGEVARATLHRSQQQVTLAVRREHRVWLSL